MKRIILFSLGLSLIGILPRISHAEDQTTTVSDSDKSQWADKMVDHRLKKMTKNLKLTADQQTQVKTILQDEMTQMKPLHEQGKTIHKQTQDKISALLTDDQKKKMAAWKAKKHDKKSKHHAEMDAQP